MCAFKEMVTEILILIMLEFTHYGIMQVSVCINTRTKITQYYQFLCICSIRKLHNSLRQFLCLYGILWERCWNLVCFIVEWFPLWPPERGQFTGGSGSSVLKIDGLVQDCSISSALAMEILQSCTKPSKCSLIVEIDLKGNHPLTSRASQPMCVYWRLGVADSS